MLPRPATEAKLLNGLSRIPLEDLAQERQRFARHRERFRLQSRSTRQSQIQFAQLLRGGQRYPLQAQGDFCATAMYADQPDSIVIVQYEA